MKKHKNNFCITLLLYYLTLNANFCLRWLWGTEDPASKDLPVLPGIVRSHVVDRPPDPNPKAVPPLSDVVSSHAIDRSPDPKPEAVPLLPDIVRSQVATPDEILNNAEIETIWNLAQEVTISVNASEKKVLEILESIRPELDKLSNHVVELSNCVKLLPDKSVKKAEIGQNAGCDVAELMQVTEVAEKADAPNNDITTENVAKMVDGMLLVVQDIKESIKKDKKRLEEDSKVYEQELSAVQETVKRLKIDSARAVEIAQEAVTASKFAIQHINIRPNIVKEATRVIEDKEVTALEVARLAKATSIKILEGAQEQKGHVTKTLVYIAEISTEISKVTENTSKAIEKVEGIEEYIASELTLLRNRTPLIKSCD